MNRPAQVFLLASLLSLSVAWAADEEVQLCYRFERLDGKAAVYTIETEQRVFQEVRGQGGGEVTSWVRETQEQRFGRAARGRGRVELTTRRIEARLESSEQRTEFDSDAGEEPPPRLQPLVRKIDRPVVLDVDRTGEVEQVRGVKVSERKSYEASFLLLPSHRLRVGEAWDRLERRPMPPLGSLAYHFHYRLRSVSAATAERSGRWRIEATVRVLYEEDAGPRPHASVEITRQSGGGHVVFDEDGLLRESLFESELEITIKTVAGTQVQQLRNRTVQVLRSLEEAERAGNTNARGE
jgi:hypothetical protein